MGGVLIVDDHPVVRLGLTLVLQRAGNFVVCGEADNVASARESIVRLQPDFTILDLGLGGRDGVELVHELAELHPDGKILVFSALPELTYARRVFQAGGHGYLMKDEGPEKVPQALVVLAAGERYASPAVHSAFFQEFAGGVPPRDSADPLATLSTRELQVLRLLGAGWTLGDVARDLKLSVKTVGTHRERLKEKLGVENARDLVRLAADLLRTGQL